MRLDLEKPWLVAVWPGMGGVAQIAGTYLARQVGARRVAEIQPRDHFDVSSVHVQSGLVQLGEMPRNLLFAWHNPGGGPDLLIFVGEAQPSSGCYRFCEEILRLAREFGVSRVVTFAAMATPIRPEAEPRVFGAASRPDVLDEVRRVATEPLEEGEITGLNGVFLAAAAAEGIQGSCLLGEFPYFASSVANPKASAAVLRAFARMSGIGIDLSELEAQALVVERSLVQHLRRLEQAADVFGANPGEVSEGEEWRIPREEPEERLSPRDRTRIEALFTEASRDRSMARDLKRELDRHGVFPQYEDRFLDLFSPRD